MIFLQSAAYAAESSSYTGIVERDRLLISPYHTFYVIACIGPRNSLAIYFVSQNSWNTFFFCFDQPATPPWLEFALRTKQDGIFYERIREVVTFNLIMPFLILAYPRTLSPIATLALRPLGGGPFAIAPSKEESHDTAFCPQHG